MPDEDRDPPADEDEEDVPEEDVLSEQDAATDPTVDDEEDDVEGAPA